MTTSQLINALRRMDPSGQSEVLLAIPGGQEDYVGDPAELSGLRREGPDEPIELFSLDALCSSDMDHAEPVIETVYREVLWEKDLPRG